MSYTRLKQSRTNILSSVKNADAGSYDFWTTIISLDSLEQRQINSMHNASKVLSEALEQSMSPPLDDFKTYYDIQCLARHEYTHYVECTSTVWGLSYLNFMAMAYVTNSDTYVVKEESFYIAKQFSDYLRFIRLPAYFTEQGKAHGRNHEWTYTETIGNRFLSDGNTSDYPVLFARFLDNQGKLIVRSPVSVLSILECSAMSQEIQFRLAGLSSLNCYDEYKAESKRYEAEIKDYFYDKDITEYSVCAHLIASKTGINNVFDVFRMCALLCRFVLDASEEVYDLILERCNVARVLNIPAGDPFEGRFRLGLEYREPGFLFYLMCKAIGRRNNTSVSMRLIEEGMKVVGITPEEYERFRQTSIRNITAALMLNPETEVRKIALTGVRNLKKIRPSNPVIPFDSLELPPVYLGDCSAVNIFSTASSASNEQILDNIYETLHRGQRWVTRFVEAC
ncbi:hypothetical protein [Pantoea agglomerans]